MSNSSRIISIREITASHFPPKTQYTYSCRVEFIATNGQILLQKNLLARKQPDWLLQLKNKGDCLVRITLQYNQGNEVRTWQKIGTVDFSTTDIFNGELSKILEFKINNWEEAPDLTLVVSLIQSQFNDNEQTNKINLVHHQTSYPTHPDHQSDSSVKLEIPEPVILTAQDEVIVKDVWNKLRAFKELSMEMFFKRLLWEEPDLDYYFGEFLDEMCDRFYEFFDLCVKQIQPQTENVLRESLIGSPIENNKEWQTIEDYCDLFTGLGMNWQHWLTARKVWMWMLPQVAYLEDYDRENLLKGKDSALYRFFTNYIIIPTAQAQQRYEEELNPAKIEQMKKSWQIMSADKRNIGREFYQTLFQKYPEILPLFGTADLDFLSTHLFQSLDFLVHCLAGGDTDSLLQELRELGLVHGSANVPPSAYPAFAEVMFILFERHVPNFNEELKQSWLTLFNRVANIMKQPQVNENRLLKKAREFLDLISQEQKWEKHEYEKRWQEIETEIKATGFYTHTYEELAYGACVAWRNASQCIGRIQWQNLLVRDCRQVDQIDEMWEELRKHLRIATNGGNLQATMTVFRPRMPKERWGPRIWNPQLIRYAAYEQADGSILGDPANLELTKKIIELGWQPPEKPSAFDILPVVIELPGQKPRFYQFPQQDILEVEIKHPLIAEFGDLGLRWYAIPAISNFRVEIGGINYCCIPFNGWYMETEIARDFLDPWRYNLMGTIAKKLGIATDTEQSFWRDRLFLELNTAIVYSFNQAQVTIVDHHTASQQFLTHDLREKKAGRECPANWGWVVPPAGGSTCPVYHHEMRDFHLTPHYYHSADKWKVEAELNLDQLLENRNNQQDSNRILILYGSETGTAEDFARQAGRKLTAYSPKVMALDEYDTQQTVHEKLILIITSTFSEGQIPRNGQKFLAWLEQLQKGSLDDLNYSVLAIGSTVYDHFCAAGITIDKKLKQAGANCIVPLHKADQIKGQLPTFNLWLGLVSRILGEDKTSAYANLSQNQTTLKLTYLSQPPQTLAPQLNTIDVALVPVIANYELLQNNDSTLRSTRQVIFDTQNSNLEYHTSDHLAIHPCNPPELVEALCQRLEVNPESYITVCYVDNQGQEIKNEKLPFPVPITIRQLLTEELDLSIQEPFNELLAYIYSVTIAEKEKRTLETWLDFLSQGDNTAVCLIQKKHISDNYFTLLDILNEFPSAQVKLDQLLELLPKQKPRLYSISSSSEIYPQEVHITASVLQIETKPNKIRKGLCSNYLKNLQTGNQVKVSVRKSNFRPPKDDSAIMLLVGAGTGISPLIAFLQHRQAQLTKKYALNLEQNSKKRTKIWEFLQKDLSELFKVNPQSQSTSQSSAQNENILHLISEKDDLVGKAYVYFGCRNYSDFLYQDALRKWVQQGVITELNVAFSRVGKEKVYIQDIITNQREKVWQILSDTRCHYYVCGDAKMSNEVGELLISIARKYGKLSLSDAKDFIENMKQENRFSTDVWGITLNYKEAIKELQRVNYNRAEKWLKMLEKI